MRQNSLGGSQTDRAQQSNPLQNQQLQYMANQGNQSSRAGYGAPNAQAATVKSYFEPKDKGQNEQVRSKQGATNTLQQVNIAGVKPPISSRQPRQVQINQAQIQKQQSASNPAANTGTLNIHNNTEVRNMMNNQTAATGGISGYQPLRNVQRSNTAGKHGAQQQLTIAQGNSMPTTSVGHRTGGLKFKNQNNSHVSPPNSNPNFALGQAFEQIPQMNVTASQLQGNDSIPPQLSPRPVNSNLPHRSTTNGGNKFVQQVHQSHDGLLQFTQGKSPNELTANNHIRPIQSTKQVKTGNQYAVTNSTVAQEAQTPQLSNFHPPSSDRELGLLSKGSRQRQQNIKNQQQHYDERYGDKANKLRANTTSETRKIKDQQQNKGDKRTSTDNNLILAVSHGNKQNDQNAQQTTHPSRYSPPTQRLGKIDQHPLSVSQDRPVSKRGPVEDPFFPDSTVSKHSIPRPSKAYMQGQKNNNLVIQTPSAQYSGLQSHQQQLTDRTGAQSNRIQNNQTLDTYNFQNPITQRTMNSSGNGTVNNQNHSIPQIRKANLRELRKNHRLQQNVQDNRQANNPNMNSINPLTSVELAQQYNKRERERAAAHVYNQNPGSIQKQSNEAFSSPHGNKDQSPLPGQSNQSIPLKSSRHKEVQRSLDSRRQILPHGGFMKESPNMAFVGGNQLITPTGNHNQVNRSQDFTRQQDQNRRESSDNRVSNVAQLISHGQLRKRGKKTSTNQSYSHGQMQNELMRELNLQKARKQFPHVEESQTQNSPLNLNPPPGRPLVGLQSERHKRTRQSFQPVVSNTLTGLSQKSHQDIQHDPHNQQSNRDNNNGEPGQRQLEVADRERFNAITKFAFATSCGHQPGNPYKVNQDTYTLTPNMCGQQGFHLFTVCDGHGVNGHKVSGEIKIELPKLLEQRLKQDIDFLENTQNKEFQERLPTYFRDCFDVIHESFFHKPYDCHLSGSTVTSVLFDSKRIYCANAGDSRAVLYTQSKKGGLKVTPLSEDHKPGLPKEKARVEKCNGRVEPIIGPQGQYLGPDRVWMLNEDTPGLAMSRSLGDGLAHTLGVSWEPGETIELGNI